MFKVIYFGGTKGAFLCYFLCKFSGNDLDIENPFAPDGTAHEIVQQGMFPLFHEDFIVKNPNAENLHLVVPSLNTWTHYLYFLLSCKIRAGNTRADPDYLWQRSKYECNNIKGLKEDIWNLQNMHYIGHDREKFSKKEIRDWYKQHFDDKLENFNLYKTHKKFENDPWFNKQKVYRIDFEAFLDWNIFKQEIVNADKKLSIGIDFTREKEMLELYNESIKKDSIISQCINIEHILAELKKGQHSVIPSINVVCESYILSLMEKKTGKKIIVGNDFPKSTKDFL